MRCPGKGLRRSPNRENPFLGTRNLTEGWQVTIAQGGVRTSSCRTSSGGDSLAGIARAPGMTGRSGVVTARWVQVVGALAQASDVVSDRAELGDALVKPDGVRIEQRRDVPARRAAVLAHGDERGGSRPGSARPSAPPLRTAADPPLTRRSRGTPPACDGAQAAAGLLVEPQRRSGAGALCELPDLHRAGYDSTLPLHWQL